MDQIVFALAPRAQAKTSIVERAAIPPNLGIGIAGQLPGLVTTKQLDRDLPILQPAPIAQPVGLEDRQVAVVEELHPLVIPGGCLALLAAPELRQQGP